MQVEVAYGEVVDRTTILRIKAARLVDPAALAHVADELAALESAWAAEALPPMARLPEWEALAAVNLALWEVEDALRLDEAAGDFGPGFVARARSVYALNDRRAALKRAINLSLGSRIVEEKSYGHRTAAPSGM